ncbi:MAG: protein rep [Selenomonadaceae bacterium]|nr:protein rep [Selenomonadaceae bacterium]
MGIIDELKDIFNMSESKRRSRLGVGVAEWKDSQPWYYRNPLADWLGNKRPEKKDGEVLPDKFVTQFGDENGKLLIKDPYLLQRNGKKALAMRSVETLPDYIRQKIDQRRDWNKQNRPVSNVLEQFFPSFQFSYATPLPQAYHKGSVDLVVSEKGNARVSDIARSHSIWLDPVDAPKELYKYRLRIQRVINWAYKVGCVPYMMTLTIHHRWNHLDGLLTVLREAWKDLLSNYAGRKRAKDVELQGWIRRLEVTINDAGENSKSNDGWHPHYHAIVIVPKEKSQRLSDVEQEWRDAWVASVCKHFEKAFGKKIDESFLPAFREHGLVFSRYNSGPFKGQLRPVSDGSYLAKIMGYDSAHVFGGDSEMTDSTLKDSKIPFDLLRDSSLPAGNVDLWVEYAFATKGVPAIKFSNGLEDRVNAYFAEHPEQDDSSYKVCPTEVVVASLSNSVHQLLYRNFLIGDLRKKTAEGYDSLCSWLKQTFVSLGVPELCECPFAMPRPPT